MGSVREGKATGVPVAIVAAVVAALVGGCGPSPAPAKSSPCQCAPKASAALGPVGAPNART